MTTPEIHFAGFPKMARLTREVVVTEKIDGTNAGIYIDDTGQIFAASRTRWITPGNDNYGFAGWVESNREELRKLGPGMHWGEWWGAGIQRRYDQPTKRFSLFNVQRWINSEAARTNDKQEVKPAVCDVVPVLFRGGFNTGAIDLHLWKLEQGGSVAAPGFMDPEGIIVFHVAAGIGFKKTIKDDESPKSLVKTLCAVE